MDLFVVPTISFRLLYGLLIMVHGRRQILWFGVTTHPTAEWIANQITEACGWEQAPRYLVRDRDRAYGEIFVQGFDQWASAIDQHRRAPHGRTDMLNGLSVRSDGNASIISSSWANGTFDTSCCRT
jgi:hypothetical protein